MKVIAFDPEAADLWDHFVGEAINATFLHQRRFLSYHGNRFVDKSLLIENNKGELFGVLPAAVAPDDPGCIVSHPGATYGGIVSKGALYGERCIDAVNAIAQYYRDAGYSRLIYKAVPHIYHQQPFQDDLYALFRVGARRIRCDLSASIELSNRGVVSNRRRRGLKKAQNAGVSIEYGAGYMNTVWTILRDNLKQKHSAKPVHTLKEITQLHKRFPDQIEIIVAVLETEVVAGTILFDSPCVSHAQYIGSGGIGYKHSVLDAVFYAAIQRAQTIGKRYFDFGISNERGGYCLNESLYQFKTQFGAGGIVHEFYEIDL